MLLHMCYCVVQMHQTKGQSMKVKVEGSKLTIELDITPGSVSKSGKTLVVATTGGFVKTGEVVGGKPLSIAVNAIVPKG